MNYTKINGEDFYNMMVNASNELEAQKEFVNSLNVFPVPDGDTGTNMSMTFRAAVEEIKILSSSSIGEVSKRMAKGALMGARGNSGVILSQILRGIAKGLENKAEADVAEFGESLMEGSRSAYKAVMRPTEGTILTIIRAAGESAVRSAAGNIDSLLEEVCQHSKDVLNKTPEMLPVLKKAKVVDAGGMGLLILLNGMKDALNKGIKTKLELTAPKEVKESGGEFGPQALKNQEIKFGYCTEFIILTQNGDYEAFRSEIEPLGDSIVVVGYEDVIKTHIHTNDPGIVLSKAVKLGELSKIKIENMREQHRHLLVNEDEIQHSAKAEEEVILAEDPKEYAFVSVAMGDGIKNIFEDLGVDYVIEGGQTMNPSTQDFVDCIERLNAKNIFLLPNNKNIIMAASQAAELSDKKCVVIPTKNIPQGITAITTFSTELSLENNEDAMLKAIQRVATASVTYAVRDTEMDGKDIKEGDILGLIEGKISEVGTDIYEVCRKLIEHMVKEDSELITIFYGKDCDEAQVEGLTEGLEEQYKELDVQSYKGEQPLYYFILAVE